MLCKAEYWYVQAAVNACLGALADSACRITTDPVEFIHALRLVSETMMTTQKGAAVTKLLCSVDKFLLKQFNRAPDVVVHDTQHQKFKLPPLWAVERWTAQKEVVWDHEHSLVVLLACWSAANLPEIRNQNQPFPAIIQSMCKR